MTDTVSVRITATENASGVFQKVGAAAETAGESIERAGQAGTEGLDAIGDSTERLGTRLQTVGASLATFGAALTAALGVAAGKGIAFEAAMANVSSISGETGAVLERTSAQVRALGVELGQSPTGMAEGLYEIQSSGFAGAEAMEVLRTSTVAAGAGLTSMATSGKAITAVLNAYGLGADKAGDVSDVLFKTVESGVVTFEALASNLGSVLPIASTLNVGIEELGAAFAELTLQGINVSQAETGIANLMRSALNPTEAMTAAIEDYGAASAEALIQSEGLAGFLDFLTEASGGTSAGLNDLLGNAEATTAALALMRNEGENFTATLADMQAAAQDGAYTQGVFETQAETTAFAIQRARAAFEDFQIAATTAITPLIAAGADALSGLVGTFAALPAPIQETVGAMAALAAVGTSVSGAVLLAAPAFTSMVSGLRAATAASLAFAATPMGLAIIGITAAVGLGTAAFLKHRDSVAEAEAEYDNLVASAKELGSAIADLRLTDIGDALWADNFALKAETAFNAYERFLTAIKETPSTDTPDFLDRMVTDIIGSLEDAADPNQYRTLYTSTRESIIDSLIPDASDRQRFNDAFIDFLSLKDVVGDTTFDALQGIMDRNTELLQQGRITFDQYVSGLEYMNEANRTAAGMFAGLTDAEINNKIATDALIASQQTALTLTDSSLLPSVTTTTEAVTTQTQAVDNLRMAWNAVNNLPPSSRDPVASDWSQNYFQNLERLQDAEQEWLANGDNILDFWVQYQENLRKTASEYGELKAAALDAGTAVPTAPNLAGMADDAFISIVRMADALDDAGAGLDVVLRTYQQIDDLGQRSAASGSIAENLVGEPGVWAEIDEMYQRWIASGMDATEAQERYNRAVAAGYNIQASNVRVQEDLNQMRVDQLPLLEAEQAAYERQIEAISQLPPLEQRRALAMQDANVQAQIATQYATAYSASLGEIPTEVATSMIVSAAEADPVIKDLLLQFGLIEEGADGTIRVNFPDGPTVQESITQLTGALVMLMDLLDDGEINGSISIDTSQATAAVNDLAGTLETVDATTANPTVNVIDNATAPLDGISIDLNTVDATTVDPTVNVNDNASGPISSVLSLLNSLPSSRTTTLTTNVVTNYVTSGAPPRGVPRDLPFATGGMPGLATGGVSFWGAELGPELLHFAAGGVAPIMQDRTYVVPPMTYVSPAHANPGIGTVSPIVNVYVGGNVVAQNDLTTSIAAAIWSAERDDAIRHRVAAGVMA